MTTRLRDLKIERVALVSAGDDPAARVVFWKRREEGEGMSKALEDALGALRASGERTAELTAETKRRADRLLADMGGDRGSVSKATNAAAKLYEIAQRDLDRHPTDRHGDGRSVEMALANVIGTPEGRQAWRAIEDEGRLGKQAFAKAFGLESPEPPERTPTAGERKVEELAARVAKDRGITLEQATAEVVKTPDGRAAFAAAVEERRSA